MEGADQRQLNEDPARPQFLRLGSPQRPERHVGSRARLLLERGHQVIEYTRHSDDIRGRGAAGMLQGALATPWNPSCARAVSANRARSARHYARTQHNSADLALDLFGSAWAGCPPVLTLHNYRTYCAAGIPLRENRPCTDCLDQESVLPVLRHGCYRGSRVATLPLAAMIALHRGLGTWRRQVGCVRRADGVSARQTGRCGTARAARVSQTALLSRAARCRSRGWRARARWCTSAGSARRRD